MKNIKQESNYVRVIGNTRNPDNESMNEMIGQELEVVRSYYNDDTMVVYNKDKSDSWYFKKKDVRFLTPAMHKGKHIAIGDEVLLYGSWKKVMGLYVYMNEARIQTGTPENTEIYNGSQIRDHRTGVVASLSGKEVDVIVDGVTYKAKII